MTRDPIHPGETLREDLDALGMSAAELARRIEVPTNRITEILNGRRAVTGDTALRLGRFFGTSGEFWINLQKLYELRLAERKNGAEVARLSTLDTKSCCALPDEARGIGSVSGLGHPPACFRGLNHRVFSIGAGRSGEASAAESPPCLNIRRN